MAYQVCCCSLEVPRELGKSERRAQRRKFQNGHMLGRVLLVPLTAQAGQGTVTNTETELLLIVHSSSGVN